MASTQQGWRPKGKPWKEKQEGGRGWRNSGLGMGLGQRGSAFQNEQRWQEGAAGSVSRRDGRLVQREEVTEWRGKGAPHDPRFYFSQCPPAFLRCRKPPWAVLAPRQRPGQG